MLNLSNYTHHGWHQFMYDTGDEETLVPRELASPGREPYLPMWKVCVPATIWQRGCGVHCGVVAIGIIWAGRQGCPTRPHPRCGGVGTSQELLFRNGSLTLMNMASLMIIVMPCASLPTLEKTVHIETMSRRLTLFIYGARGPWMSF